MTIALADLRKLASMLPLLATCSCGADPTQPPLGAAGSAGSAGTSFGGAGAGGTSGGAGSSSGTSNGGSLATAGAGGTGGGSGGFGAGGAPPGSPTFTQVTAILQLNCGSKCHSGEREDLINLSGAPEALYARLTSPLDTNLCYRATPVQRGSAANSLLARVLKAEVSTPCPLPRMPAGCAQNNECLSDADIAVIDGWINAGAYQN